MQGLQAGMPEFFLLLYGRERGICFYFGNQNGTEKLIHIEKCWKCLVCIWRKQQRKKNCRSRIQK